MKPFYILIFILALNSCKQKSKLSQAEDQAGKKSSGNEELSFRADFSDLEGWKDDCSKGSPSSYSITGGILRISTRAESRDRVKIQTEERFGAGLYTWRVFVPTMGEGDQAGIGAFLYKDDKHEVDFEIGYGELSVREDLKAEPSDLVCYCTSQGYPFSSDKILIKPENWYIFSMDLVCEKDGDYLVTWFIDGKQVKQLQCSFGEEVTFTSHCSVENLLFLGEHIPTQENYGLFDYFEFIPSSVKSMDKTMVSDSK